MRYYVIQSPEKKVAVIFHDYLTANFIVKSTSECFRRAFEASVSTNSDLSFTKRGKRLEFKEFGPQYPSWIDKVLSKICGKFWTICKTGNITGDAFVEDIALQYLTSI